MNQQQKSNYKGKNYDPNFQNRRGKGKKEMDNSQKTIISQNKSKFNNKQGWKNEPKSFSKTFSTNKSLNKSLNKTKQTCRYFKKGECKNGEKCRYRHTRLMKYLHEKEATEENINTFDLIKFFVNGYVYLNEAEIKILTERYGKLKISAPISTQTTEEAEQTMLDGMISMNKSQLKEIRLKQKEGKTETPTRKKLLNQTNYLNNSKSSNITSFVRKDQLMEIENENIRNLKEQIAQLNEQINQMKSLQNGNINQNINASMINELGEIHNQLNNQGKRLNFSLDYSNIAEQTQKNCNEIQNKLQQESEQLLQEQERSQREKEFFLKQQLQQSQSQLDSQSNMSTKEKTIDESDGDEKTHKKRGRPTKQDKIDKSQLRLSFSTEKKILGLNNKQKKGNQNKSKSRSRSNSNKKEKIIKTPIITNNIEKLEQNNNEIATASNSCEQQTINQ